ncbi:hypothetical protein HH214_18540 [Mucilaginibacter robiniae]|uniref:Uncharacterized protein n=1 Tax=Mucilaginibacter robiniae TaxID=2728022 RepID=A0A7L5E2X2_9SPHI|nr:hypothetical protein [Mucilaginibacter robiniae]QJD97730.1 hypothetical protein HH214_18540 [Mucilaginibacter robiniae]
MISSVKPLHTIELSITPNLFEQSALVTIDEKVDFGYKFILVEEAYEFKLAIRRIYLIASNEQQACKYLAEKTCILHRKLDLEDKGFLHNYVLCFLTEVEAYLDNYLPKTCNIEKVKIDDGKIADDIIASLSKDGFFS